MTDQEYPPGLYVDDTGTPGQILEELPHYFYRADGDDQPSFVVDVAGLLTPLVPLPTREALIECMREVPGLNWCRDLADAVLALLLGESP